ncbi:hypothetical protein AK830_g3732 [Neonectria ditissima]|uniref:FAD-binding domain-containing protein n=1 Tax=Neonectria ditissima TaxID=78410 RepID=A0A0P7BQP4_9HYPO|nr:hypothetical protein AK830_g3732 [Neonectria ditissima]
MESKPKPKALIVGAGIAGLSAAWWLDKAGWTSTLIDKAPAIRDGGYMVGLTGLCINTIKEMNLDDQLGAISYTFDENVIRDNKGKELLRVAYKDIHGELDNHSVCRDDLARILARALPETATIRFSETLEHALEVGDKIKATLKSGETIKADLLIGADGIRSSVRGMFWEDEDCLEDLNYSYAVYDVEWKKKLEAGCVSFNSPGHLDILYSPRSNQLAALHIWRDEHTEHQDRQLRFETLRRATAGGAKLVDEVIDIAEERGVSPVIDSLTMVSLRKWSKGRILLLGDAAHCLTLMSGQGAGMAIASAEILGKELMATEDVLEALVNHEQKLRQPIESLQHRSRRMAAMYIPRNRFWYWLRNLLFKITPYSWIVSYHVSGAKAEIALVSK